MDRKKKLRLAVTPIALAALAAPFAAGGCDTLTNDGNPLGAVCCTDFKPGTNMIDIDWGLSSDADNKEFGAALQAIGDFSATAQGMVNDLGVACKGLAIDLGSMETAVNEKDPNEYTKKWCAEAATQLTALKAQVSLVLSVQPARCEVNVSAKLDCQAQCSAQAMCTLTPGEIEASCEPGKLSGKCTGSCTGSCEGSSNLAVSCNGSCSGTCEGMCMGTQDGGACQGTCNGKCRGECQQTGSAMVSCEGTCSGSCDVDFQAPKCNGKFTPPMGKCDASASCQGSCDASATAKAECTPPSVDVEFSGGAQFEAKIAALQKWLPTIFSNTEGRLSTLQGELQAITDVAGNFQADLSGSAKAVFCIVPAGDALTTAGANIQASVEAGVSIGGAVGQ